MKFKFIIQRYIVCLLLVMVPLSNLFAATEIEPNNDSSTATYISSDIYYSGRTSKSRDYDWFTFTINDPSMINYSFIHDPPEGSSKTPYWRIYIKDSNNNTIKSHIDERNEIHDFIGLDQGTYFFRIQPGATLSYIYSSTYYLKISIEKTNSVEIEPNDEASEATHIIADSIYDGKTSDSRDYDWYVFTLNTVSKVNYSFTHDPPEGTSKTPYWRIYIKDSNYNNLKSHLDERNEIHDFIGLDQGTYFFRIQPGATLSYIYNTTYHLKINLEEIVIDSDNDGIPDHLDHCPHDPDKSEPGLCGCGEKDTDNDNTCDKDDNCPNDPNKIEPGLCGCGDKDSDNDNTCDRYDNCPNDPNKIEPGNCGCGDKDSDNDNTCDKDDRCPNDPDKIEPGFCGCGDKDTDNDNTCDKDDICPNDPNKTEPGLCGCGDKDSDNDKTCDRYDNCPSDPNKVEPGKCGCGDKDSDNDNTCDKYDRCPNDPNKVEPGLCGCNDKDSDNDKTCDLYDNCPKDPNKIEPGKCGCGDKDSDNDNTCDRSDRCPNDPDKIEPGFCGCGDKDTDNDNTCNKFDNCPNDPNKTDPGLCGCGDKDSDNDNTCDKYDNCPNDPNKTEPGKCGCGDKDSDNDRTCDKYDRCPNDPNKVEPGPCGCNDKDSDNDKTCDRYDNCPNDPNKTEPGACGCGDKDSDNDSTCDKYDSCPNDPDKIEPGFCGCGDKDTDNDNICDLYDNCPNDPNKSLPGKCGCGDNDTDNDDACDSIDKCPNDPNKTEPGACGCGFADTDFDNDTIPDCKDNCISNSEPLNISSLTVPPIELHQYYELYITAKGGTCQYTYFVAMGTLPDGLVLNTYSGKISGTIRESGSFLFVITVQDSDGNYAKREYEINVIDPLEFQTGSNLPGGTYDVEYFESITAIGGMPAYQFSIISGQLPEGLFLSENGMIKGVPVHNNSQRQEPFIIQVTDTLNHTFTKEFFLQISEPLIIETKSLQVGIIEKPYNQVLSVFGGSGSNKWSIYSGKLPEGLIIDNNNSLICGKPLEEYYGTIVLSVSDKDKRVTYKDVILHIVPPLDIPMSKLPDALKNQTYSEVIRVTGGIAPYTFTCIGLPGNIKINRNTGVIEGISVSAGLNNVSISVSDSTKPSSQTYSKTVPIETTSKLTIQTNAVLPKAVKNRQINPIVLQAGGGISPYTWSVSQGRLPTGIDIDSKSGRLSGIPFDKGNITFTIKIIDSNRQTSHKTFIWYIIDVLEIKTSFNLVVAEENIENFVLKAKGGIPPYFWRFKTGNLPEGMTFNPDTGTISGLPEKKQTRTFTIEVNDSDIPAQKADKSITIEVLENELYISTPILADGRVDEYYSASIKAVLGKPPYSWKIESGTLPKGMSLNNSPNSPIIGGVPKDSGEYPFKILVKDSNTPSITATQEYYIQIFDKPVIQKHVLPPIEINKYYQTSIEVLGGKPPYIWRVIEGCLPEGLQLSPTKGLLYGQIINEYENSEFTVQVEDSFDLPETTSQTYLLYVSSELKILPEELHKGMQFHYYNIDLDNSGGISPFYWGIHNDNLPKCIEINPTTGIISGIPVENGIFEFSVTLQDSSIPSSSTIRTYQLEITPSDINAIYGDINSNGSINIDDAIIMLKVLVGMETNNILLTGDINHDCKINIWDILDILEKVANSY